MIRSLALLPLLAAASLLGQEPAARMYDIRYNIEMNPINYPQKSPQEAMASIAKAINAGAFEYLMGQLVDPPYVDNRVAEFRKIIVPREEIVAEEEDIAREPDPIVRKKKILDKERKDRARNVVAFNRLALETRKHLDEDPVLLKELRLFAKNGEWEIDEERAVGSLKGVSPRKVYLRKREDRWFMEERNQ